VSEKTNRLGLKYVALSIALITACSSTGSESPGAGGASGGVSSGGSGAAGGSAGSGVVAGGGGLAGASGGSSGSLGIAGAPLGGAAGVSGIGGMSGAAGGAGGASGGSTSFPPGTLCNSTGYPRTPPAKIKHLIVILFENENKDAVIGAAHAPYISSLAAKCAVATAYQDDIFTDNLVSLPHYLALTSGSNCNTGLDGNGTGTGCITDDGDATAHTLSTTSIFNQASSWKSYQEGMSGSCAKGTGGRYAAKHNPAAYYTSLTNCATNDVSIAPLKCNPTTLNMPCLPPPPPPPPSPPSNAFVTDLANDDLAEFVFITPTLDNDMHDGTITQADNWVATYLPLITGSKAYLRGEVVVQLLWDEQTSSEFGGPIPNVFISPYVTAGKTSAMNIDHFSVLRSWENALGISTYLGCASGSPPGGVGKCPSESTADVRAALGW